LRRAEELENGGMNCVPFGWESRLHKCSNCGILHIMKLTIQLKLQPMPEQATMLHQTLVRANEACNAASESAWSTHTFKQFDLHRLCYTQMREQFGLSAQLAIRCIAKVADAYKLDRKAKRVFAPLGAIVYDNRILSFNMNGSSVSLWTLNGRQVIPFVCGQRQRQLLASQHGESDLALVNGNWYLFTVCDVETPESMDVAGVLGVDLGVTTIATDSDGTIHSGKAIKNIR
jgi:putative transposase